MSAYTQDRQWSDQFIPQLKRIIGPLLLQPANFELDTKEATDLIVFQARDMRIAARLRRPGYFDKYGHQFTIRVCRETGTQTEMAKIVNGWGDWFFYGHAEDDLVRHWMVIDLDSFRAALIRNSMNRLRIKYEDRDNRDGTHFRAFDIRSFPTSPAILVAQSGSVDALLRPNNSDDWDAMWSLPFAEQTAARP